MIGEICATIKNYFTYDADKHIGDFVISEGTISPVVNFPTDYFRIVGSRLNDGVHKVSDLAKHPLKDEEFHGAIWIMSPPDHFLALVEEIESWQEMNGRANSANMSPYTSESFGGYSYSKGAGANGAGTGASWADQYASRLNIYRRIRI